MIDKLRKVLLTVAALTALAFGGAALAGAASGGADTGAQERTEATGDREEHEGSDQAVTSADASRARDAAAAETGGTPGSVERDGENGATYEVEVTKADGTQADVRLDDGFQVVVVEQDGE